MQSLDFRQGPVQQFFWRPISLPDAARIRRRHGLAGLTAESLLEFRHVADYAIHAPLAGRVRVGTGAQAQQFRRDVFAPDAGEAEKETLVRRVAIDLSIGVL